jgi:hypothetical protein
VISLRNIKKSDILKMQKESYNKEELISCGRGEMFGKGNAQLPLPPMLMFDRITSITDKGGKYKHGQIIAELDLTEDLWFFECHFQGRSSYAWLFRVGCYVAIIRVFFGMERWFRQR